MICAAGVLVRIASLALLPNIVWPDETMQYVEQASRLLGAHGLVPWEYAVGARSWLLPMLITPAVAVGRLLFHSPDAVYAAVAVEMMALSLAASIAAYRIGLAVGSQLHGLFAALLVTLWSEAVYLSPHVLADTMSASLLLITLAASLRAESLRALLIAGLLIGATFVVRLQLGPALGTIGLFALFPSPVRRGAILFVGFAVAIILAGLLDWVTWGGAFHSLLTYLRASLAGVSSLGGTGPPLSYLAYERSIWGWYSIPILFTAALGARRLPVGFLAVVVIFMTFSLVPHKEYRYIYPAIPVLMTLCGIGTAEIVTDLSAGVESRRWLVISAFTLIWAAGSAASALSPTMLDNWLRHRGILAAIAVVNADPASCGAAVAPANDWVWTGASRFRDDVRLFKYSGFSSGAFNYLLAFEGAPAPIAPFHLISCSSKDALCLYRRAGGCDYKRGVALDAPAPNETVEALHRVGLLW